MVYKVEEGAESHGRLLCDAVCDRMTTALSARRPSAGAVPGRWGACLLGGKDPTGRLLSAINPTYQSEPRTSPPAGVTAAHQVLPLIVGASVRTLPSTRPTSMPP